MLANCRPIPHAAGCVSPSSGGPPEAPPDGPNRPAVQILDAASLPAMIVADNDGKARP
jgi:hypothetical protein